MLNLVFGQLSVVRSYAPPPFHNEPIPPIPSVTITAGKTLALNYPANPAFSLGAMPPESPVKIKKDFFTIKSIDDVLKFGAIRVETDFAPGPNVSRAYDIFINGVSFGHCMTGYSGRIDGDGTRFTIDLSGPDFSEIDLDGASAEIFVTYLSNETGKEVQRFLLLSGLLSATTTNRKPEQVKVRLTFTGSINAPEVAFNRDFPGAEYISSAATGYSVRMPISWRYGIGDKIHIDGGMYSINEVSFTVTPQQEFMTIGVQ